MDGKMETKEMIMVKLRIVVPSSREVRGNDWGGRVAGVGVGGLL